MAVGQAFVPAHWMSQLEARVQSIVALHAVDPHSTRQGTPAGQVTLLVQLLVAVQSTTQVAPEQVPIVQAARQAATAAGSGASAIAESRNGVPPEPGVEPPEPATEPPEPGVEPPEPTEEPSMGDVPPEPVDVPPDPVVTDVSGAWASSMPPFARASASDPPTPTFPPVPASPVEPAGMSS